MAKSVRGSKRTLVRRSSCVNLYADQAIQVQAIMESVGETKESPVLRLLLDEALAARRRKSVNRSEPEPPPPPLEVGEILQTVQTLLLKLIRQNETGLRAHGISLVLLQETLAEATGSRKIAWNRLEVPPLIESGMSSQEIEERLALEISESKDQAYGLAEEIRQRQTKQTSETRSYPVEGELPFEDPQVT